MIIRALTHRQNISLFTRFSSARVFCRAEKVTCGQRAGALQEYIRIGTKRDDGGVWCTPIHALLLLISRTRSVLLKAPKNTHSGSDGADGNKDPIKIPENKQNESVNEK